MGWALGTATKRKLRTSALLLSLTAVVGVAIWWKWQDIVVAYATRLVTISTSALPKCDRAEIYHVTLDPAAETAVTKQNARFPVRPYDESAAIFNQTTLVGNDAEAFAELWRAQRFGHEYQSLCHEPAYAVRFYSGNSLLFETSICFHCSNFYVSGLIGAFWWGFDPATPAAASLLERLQKLFPDSLPKKPDVH